VRAENNGVGIEYAVSGDGAPVMHSWSFIPESQDHRRRSSRRLLDEQARSLEYSGLNSPTFSSTAT
jgi:hypothetical protein